MRRAMSGHDQHAAHIPRDALCHALPFTTRLRAMPYALFTPLAGVYVLRATPAA